METEQPVETLAPRPMSVLDHYDPALLRGPPDLFVTSSEKEDGVADEAVAPPAAVRSRLAPVQGRRVSFWAVGRPAEAGGTRGAGGARRGAGGYCAMK